MPVIAIPIGPGDAHAFQIRGMLLSSRRRLSCRRRDGGGPWLGGFVGNKAVDNADTRDYRPIEILALLLSPGPRRSGGLIFSCGPSRVRHLPQKWGQVILDMLQNLSHPLCLATALVTVLHTTFDIPQQSLQALHLPAKLTHLFFGERFPFIRLASLERKFFRELQE
ncbi:MAG: hypothetical protein LBD54_02055 [Puniceicoccales bacterium]|nr:hypothetical protein [Puniceicoccales bacterium]